MQYKILNPQHMKIDEVKLEKYEDTTCPDQLHFDNVINFVEYQRF